LGGALLLAAAAIIVALLALDRGAAPGHAPRPIAPASAEPQPPAPAPPEPPAVKVAEEAPSEPKPGARLVGRVTDEDGHPVADAGIWLSKGRGSGEGDVVARTGQDGSYVYDGVDGEERLVGAIAAKHAPSDLRRIAPRTQTVFEIDFKLRRGGGTLAISVAGADVADVFIEPVFLVGPESPGRRHVEVRGRATFDGLVPEWSFVRVRARGYAPRTLLTRLPPEGVVQADVRLDEGAVVLGTVHGADGGPAPGAHIDLVGWEWAKLGVAADEKGAYRMENAPAALVELLAAGTDGAQASALARLEEKKDHRWDPVLQRALEITGRVVDESGAPVVPAYLSCWPVGSFRSQEVFEADAEGRFRTEALPNREHRIAVWWGGTMVPPAAEVTAMPGGPPLTITLPRADGFLVGLVAGSEGLPAGGTRVRTWPSGSPNREMRVFTASDGTFRIGPLPSGSYFLELHLDGEPTLFRDGIGITAGETTDLGTLRFAAGGRIRARVVDGSGSPLLTEEDPLVRSLDGTVTYVVELDGPVALSEELVPGRYLVSGGMAGIIEEAEVRADATTSIDLKLRGGGMLEVVSLLEDGSRTMATYRITDEHGHPVAGLDDPVNPCRILLASGFYRVEALGATGGRASGEVIIPADGSETKLALALR